MYLSVGEQPQAKQPHGTREGRDNEISSALAPSPPRVRAPETRFWMR